MIVSVVVPSTSQPSGGVLGIVEFANGLARRGHEVHLLHVPFLGLRLRNIEELAWCPLDPTITHHITDDLESSRLPDADVALCFDGRVPRSGLPLTFLQAYNVLPPDIERSILTSPGPILCTSTWLRQVAIDHGVPAHRALHLPYGIRHEKYRLTAPIEERPLRVAMLYNSHPLKNAEAGIAALDHARRAVPDLEATIFSTTGTLRPLPDWMTYLGSPSQKALVEDVYNRSRVFVSPALAEGFGLAAVESMACGCALVTTANGGSDDYARDGETALVTPPGEVEPLAAAIVRAVTDDQLRSSLAIRGRETALGFDWDRSAEILEAILVRYADDPGALLFGLDG